MRKTLSAIAASLALCGAAFAQEPYYQLPADPPDSAAQLTELTTLFDELCLHAFPIDDALREAVIARGAVELSAAEVEAMLHDDPGAAWAITGATGRFVITLEYPPYHACGVRVTVKTSDTAKQVFDDFVAAHAGGRRTSAMPPISGTMRGVRSDLWAYQVAAEAWMLAAATPLNAVSDPNLGTEVRFVRQIVTGPAL